LCYQSPRWIGLVVSFFFFNHKNEQHILQSKENIHIRICIRTQTQRIQMRKLPHPNHTRPSAKKKNKRKSLKAFVPPESPPCCEFAS
jgi:hypothetical protein